MKIFESKFNADYARVSQITIDRDQLCTFTIKILNIYNRTLPNKHLILQQIQDIAKRIITDTFDEKFAFDFNQMFVAEEETLGSLGFRVHVRCREVSEIEFWIKQQQQHESK